MRTSLTHLHEPKLYGTVYSLDMPVAHRVVFDIEGNPSEIVSRAHDVAGEHLGHAPWHFTIITFTSPMTRGMGEKSDSCWLGHFVAELKGLDPLCMSRGVG